MRLIWDSNSKHIGMGPSPKSMSRELKCAELSGWVDLTYICLPKGRVSNMAKKDIYVWDLHFLVR